MYTQFISCPIGILKLASDGTSILGIEFVRKKKASQPDPLTKRCAAEIKQYFAGLITDLSVPFRAEGTHFQKSVWKAMSKIPYGQIKTYAEIAKLIGRPKASRGVGGACGKNPVLLLIPCHRVVGSNGYLGGFRAGMGAKKILLDLERPFSHPPEHHRALI